MVAVVRAQVVEPLRVSSDSMVATLSRGDGVLVDKLGPRLGSIERGQLVTFRPPSQGNLALKRVVAIGGDEIAVRDAVLYVNDEAVEEPYVDAATVDGSYFGPVRVGAGKVFLMGDNRANSIDSRDYGGVPLEAVDGRVVLQVWPLGRLGVPGS